MRINKYSFSNHVHFIYFHTEAKATYIKPNKNHAAIELNPPQKKVTKVDNKAAEDTITQLEKLADLTKLNELESGIDDFSDKMIQLINQNRDKLKDSESSIIFKNDVFY